MQTVRPNKTSTTFHSSLAKRLTRILFPAATGDSTAALQAKLQAQQEKTHKSDLFLRGRMAYQFNLDERAPDLPTTVMKISDIAQDDVLVYHMH